MTKNRLVTTFVIFIKYFYLRINIVPRLSFCLFLLSVLAF